MRTACCLLCVISAGLSVAQGGGEGQVQLPLEAYDRLVATARGPDEAQPPAPAPYALGSAAVAVRVMDDGSRTSAEVRVELKVAVLEDRWMAVPVLPVGTPVDSVMIGGRPVQLIATTEGLAWSVRESGSYTMSLGYRLDAVRSDSGFAATVPVPFAAAIGLTAELPGTELDVAVVPAAGVRSQVRGGSTVVQATVPTTTAVQLLWRAPVAEGLTVSRARYSGRLAGDAVLWAARLEVEVFVDRALSLDLLPRSVTLSAVSVDGTDAPILVDGERFATSVHGRGRHTVGVGFEVPVLRGEGPPRVELPLVEVPVSRFELELPGSKEVAVQPAANVIRTLRDGNTVATVHVPMTRRVAFTWSEAVPEAEREEVRANASIFHTVHAEQGVLEARATVVYELTRGGVSTIRLALPVEVQVNRVEAVEPVGTAADWRVAPAAEGTQEVTVFLDRRIDDRLLLEVGYDRSLEEGHEVVLPLLRALDVHRQRGMVALLASRELALGPTSDDGAARVGENQLPAFVREAVEMTIAHTLKYVEGPPRLSVVATPPERRQGRFDARVDTLVSLGEVTLKGSASVEVEVKSGGITELVLGLPYGTSLLSLSGPSLRTSSVRLEAGRQVVEVQFTQEMDGQFRLEAGYERILTDAAAAAEVPILVVRGAEVEQGRVAVEALSAVEVQVAEAVNLTALDISELPQQLILRTTNPILLAYTYVQSDPPPRLGLAITRHAMVEVQEAAIDLASYRTLVTRDGLAVTTARFVVRNSRKQFLRVQLPEGAEVWSSTVDGRPEKPAVGEDEDEGSVLIRIINSTRGFPVRLIYACRGSRLGGLGTLSHSLPRPDILVTRSRWDVYLPEGMSYGEPTSSMDLVVSGEHVERAELAAELGELDGAGEGGSAAEPLRITVPAAGIHLALEKLYANQGDAETWLEVPYASRAGATFGRVSSLLGAGLLWAGVILLLWPRPAIDRRVAVAAVVVGGLTLLVTLGLCGVSALPASVVSVLALIGAGAWTGWRLWQRRVSVEAG